MLYCHVYQHKSLARGVTSHQDMIVSIVQLKMLPAGNVQRKAILTLCRSYPKKVRGIGADPQPVDVR